MMMMRRKYQFQAMKADPHLLCHPNVPRALHGTNPRSLLGAEWWDTQRRKAYAEFNDRCWACGCHKMDNPYRQYLEAHETYLVDYNRGAAVFDRVVALCHTCHNFIHSGRLWALYERGELCPEFVEDVIRRSMGLLKADNLKPFYFARWVELKLFSGLGDEIIMDRIRKEGYTIVDENLVPWRRWHLVLNGQKYLGLFRNEQEWEAYYSKGKS
jgi:hypothetical protein